MSDADGHHWSDAFFGMAFGLHNGVFEFVFWFGDCINCNLDLAYFTRLSRFLEGQTG